MKNWLSKIALLLALIMLISGTALSMDEEEELIKEAPKETFPASQSVMVNNVKINYVEQGAGDEVVIFVHGYAMAKETWKDVLELLPKEYHAYALDQRGHGESGRAGSYQPTEFIEDIYAFSQELGIEKFTYVGHSMGGKIGMKFALDHPGVLKALVLVCPSPAFALPDMVPVMIEGTTAMLAATPESIRGFLESEIIKPVSEERINDTANHFLAMDPAAIEGCVDFIYSYDLIPQLGDIRAPTLVVAGAKDKSSTLDIIRPTADGIKGSRLEIFEDSSHFLPIESPQEFVDLLTSFIKDVSVQ